MLLVGKAFVPSGGPFLVLFPAGGADVGPFLLCGLQSAHVSSAAAIRVFPAAAATHNVGGS